MTSSDSARRFRPAAWASSAFALFSAVLSGAADPSLMTASQRAAAPLAQAREPQLRSLVGAGKCSKCTGFAQQGLDEHLTRPRSRPDGWASPSSTALQVASSPASSVPATTRYTQSAMDALDTWSALHAYLQRVKDFLEESESGPALGAPSEPLLQVSTFCDGDIILPPPRSPRALLACNLRLRGCAQLLIRIPMTECWCGRKQAIYTNIRHLHQSSERF